MSTSARQARAQLLARQLELSDRQRRLHADRSRAQGPLPADFADQAVVRENDEVLDRIEESAHAEQQQVEHALAHLDAGHYGRCEQCGGEIDRRRLKARPEATRCVRCEAAERHH